MEGIAAIIASASNLSGRNYNEDVDTDSASDSPEQKVPPVFAYQMSGLSQEFTRGGDYEEFSKFCCLRSIPKHVKCRACHFLQDYIHLGITSLFPEVKDLYALIIYLAVIETRLPYGPTDPHLEQGTLDPPSISVTDILQMTGVNINRLFKILDETKTKTTFSNTVLMHLRKLEKNYCVVAALFHTFETRICESVFRNIKADVEDGSNLPPIPETEGVSFRKKQCWTLFLLSRHEFFQDKPELFPHLQLLLCCVEFVLRQTPSFLLNDPYDSIRFGCFSSQEAGITMLGKLAEEFEVASDGTLQLHLDRTEPFFQSLLNKDGELDSDSLSAEYEKLYHREGDLDEVQFLTKESYLMPSKINQSDKESSGQVSKLLPGQMTPVRHAVSSIGLLHKTFGSSSDCPTDKLKQHFQKCVEDPSKKIQTVLKNLRKEFVQAFCGRANMSDTAVANQRCDLAQKIYFTVLEALLNAEGERLSPQTLGNLLHRDDFHTSLFACSLEVVLTTYGQTWNGCAHEVSNEESSLSFPWLLDVFSLQAYNYFKVIDSFIKHETRLPIDVVKHFRTVETRILETDAWKESSPIFESLHENQSGQVTPPRLSSPTASPMKNSSASRTSLDMILSPVRPGYSSHHSANNEGSLQKQPEQQSQSRVQFINKVCRLGFFRLTKLCTELEIAKELQHKIWTCLEHCVTKLSQLLKNRHLDQIIMCCIYGLCKVTEHDILFKVIVSVYRDMPHAKHEICKEVYMSEGRYDSIITFYNNIFMPTVKSYFLQFSPLTEARPKLSPMPRQATASPHYSLPGNRNFTISPLKQSPFKAPMSPSKMTPATKLLYSFPESIGGLDSGEKLKHFNHRLEMRKLSGVASAKKRLNLDDVAPVESVSKARKAIF